MAHHRGDRVPEITGPGARRPDVAAGLTYPEPCEGPLVDAALGLDQVFSLAASATLVLFSCGHGRGGSNNRSGFRPAPGPGSSITGGSRCRVARVGPTGSSGAILRRFFFRCPVGSGAATSRFSTLASAG